MSKYNKAPFPYFGGKSKIAKTAWDLFGNVKNYVEPFCGSCAVLLQCPDDNITRTINDFDGMVVNFWRAVARAPDEVAHYANWPVTELDLTARHLWLVQNKSELKNRLEADYRFYDSKMAGFWCWGVCSWIGGGFCSGNGGWNAVDGTVVKNNDGKGLSISKRLPHLGDKGRGINKQLPHGISREEFILKWFLHLNKMFRDVRIACGDWKRVLTPSVTTRIGKTAVFLDPPYEHGNMDYSSGGMRLGIEKDVRQWCKESGGNNELKIILCGRGNEHNELLQYGWNVVEWKAGCGYAINKEKRKGVNEKLWCSPSIDVYKNTGRLL